VPDTLDAALLRGWVDAAAGALEQHCSEIDRINVFPVPDGDTGTNLLLTMRAAADAAAHRVLRADPGGAVDDAAAVAAAVARGALLGARGNSGVILSQVLRGVADALAEAGGRGDPAVLTDALCRGERLATAAFSCPREGTALTVLRAAAAGAARCVQEGERRMAAVISAAAVAAARALRETTEQLPELSRAGVVDAGGLGICVVLDVLACLVDDRPVSLRPVPQPVPPRPTVRDRDAPTAGCEAGSREFDYEVMYLLDLDDGAPPERVEELRTALEALGDCVAVVGDGAGLWNVHVHCADIGAAIEAGTAAGRPHRITVMRFADQVPDGHVGGGRFVRARAVLIVLGGDELVELARAAGADVLERRGARPVDEAELGAALAGTRARHVVVLPCDAGLAATVDRVACAARLDGQDVLVVPASSVPQGLAALAVHDPRRRAGEDVVAMAEAAAGTRTAGLRIAETAGAAGVHAPGGIGRGEPGEVLGIADGEVVVVAPDLTAGAHRLAHRLLSSGGEIVTVLLGAGVADALGAGLVADLRRTHPEVDTVVHRGGQTDFLMVLGVE